MCKVNEFFSNLGYSKDLLNFAVKIHGLFKDVPTNFMHKN